MTDEHCFISYSHKDADDFGYQLANELEAGNPFIDTWFDKRDILAGETWDEKVPEAIKTCKCFLFVATEKSIGGDSVCADEWDLALRYKKPILILRLQKDIELPFRLRKRQWIDLSVNFKAGMAKLRQAIQRLDLPDGQIQILKDRLADANRDLPDAKTEEEKTRILDEIYSLDAEIKANESFIRDPEKAKKLTRKNINAGLESDRQPLSPTSGKATSKFINPRPGSIPDYFEGRLIEIQEIADFLRNNFQRIMIINGRAGSGKTVLSCRVLQSMENGQFPNNLGEFKIGGIVYLSEIGNYKINVANIFSGLLRIIETKKATRIEELYKEGKIPIDEKVRELLLSLPTEPTVLLLDNFENLLDNSDTIIDQELQNALKAILQADSHSLKVLITTRVLPRELNMIEPARQFIKHLEEGLPSPFAENVLRKMDKDGRAGFRDATEELLGRVRDATLGYPRALESLYAILRVDRYASVEELLVDGMPDTVVEKYVGEAFSRLDGTSQKIVQTLAVFSRPVSSAAVDFALQFHIPGINSAPILERLVSMHFVRREAKRYFLHPADQEYALSRMPKGEISKKIGQGARARTWDKHALTLRAADYFVEVRKPENEWKKLDDVRAQLAEIDLRYSAEDYDTAGSVLLDIDGDYLFVWGHYRLAIDLHEKLQGKLNNRQVAQYCTANLGSGYFSIGEAKKSIIKYETALDIARQTNDLRPEGMWLGNLGNAYSFLGDNDRAMSFYNQALSIHRKTGNHRSEGIDLGNLGNVYTAKGEIYQAINVFEKALKIAQETNNAQSKAAILANLANSYSSLGNLDKAMELIEDVLSFARRTGYRGIEGSILNSIGNITSEQGDSIKAFDYYKEALAIFGEVADRGGESVSLLNLGAELLKRLDLQDAEIYFQQSIQIADSIAFSNMQLTTRYFLALLQLLLSQLTDAQSYIKAATQFDVPEKNHNVNILHGIIALRQGERETAQEAFTKSIEQADEILAKTPDYYSALDAKGLALSGLALCEVGKDDGRRTLDHGQSSMVYRQQAIETFEQARKIAPHAGVVKSVLRLFDELVKCDTKGILKDVRNAVEGKLPS